MNSTAAVKRHSKAPSAEALLAASCHLVDQAGLAALALRPLARQLGVSVTVLSHHFGVRAEVQDAICRSACAAQLALLAPWRSWPQAGQALLPAPLAADLLLTILEQLVDQHRSLTLLQLEVMHGSQHDTGWCAGWQRWRSPLEQFWNALGRQAGLPDALLGSGWWFGYVMAELAYGLSLSALPSYRLLRRLSLQRVLAGGAAAALPVDAGWFARLQQEMLVPSPAPDLPLRAPAWQQAAARCCGELLAAHGVGGLTHRAVAAAIGIPHTSLSYRYPSQHALVLLGLEYITAHIMAAVQADTLPELERRRMADAGHKLDLARASFAVALAAPRLMELQARNASMRAWRGSNLVHVLAKYLPPDARIDRLSAHVVSLGLLGLGNMPAAGAEQAAAFGAAAQWLQQHSQLTDHSA